MKTTTTATTLFTESVLLPIAKEVLFFVKVAVTISAIALFVASAWV